MDPGSAIDIKDCDEGDILDMLGVSHEQAKSLVGVWAANGATFPRGFVGEACNPDFRGPVSNFACHGVGKQRKRVCLRSVKVISLPQLFLHYMHETSFENVLVVYLDLPILVARRANERCRSSRRESREGNTNGSRWRQRQRQGRGERR